MPTYPACEEETCALLEIYVRLHTHERERGSCGEHMYTYHRDYTLKHKRERCSVSVN